MGMSAKKGSPDIPGLLITINLLQSPRGIMENDSRTPLHPPSLRQVVPQDIAAGRDIVNVGPKHQVKQEDGEDHQNSVPYVDGIMVHTRTFSRDEILEEKLMLARMRVGKPLGSGAHMRWLHAMMEYGPP